VVDANGRKSLDQFIDQIVTQIINSYNKYMNKLNEAAIVRSLLQNSLNILGLEEHSDIVYEQNFDPAEAKKMRYKVTIDNIKLLNNFEGDSSPKSQEDENRVYSADIYFQQRHIVETDFVSPDGSKADVEFDTSFEIDTNLLCGYLEFRIYYTICEDTNQKNFLSKKNIAELINFSDTGSNETLTDAKRNETANPFATRNSNPFESLKRAKSAQDREIELKINDSTRNISLPVKQGNSNSEAKYQNINSPEIINNDYLINNEDIKIEIDDGDRRKARATPDSDKYLSPNTHPFTQASRANSMLAMVRSPIKEENEEDETSHQETPSQSLAINPKQFAKTANTNEKASTGVGSKDADVFRKCFCIPFR
jgi:hypothetical protein